MSQPILFIGNKNYSSWSMRPWLALKWGGIAFHEEVIWLGPRGGGPDPQILAVNPSGTVPALRFDEATLIWDSLAICEWAHENAPQSQLWPTDPVARALARCIAAEMHAGFAPLRKELPMNVRARKTDRKLSDATVANIARIDTLLSGTLARFDPAHTGWLFGHPTIADAFFAPVATRFRTYNVALSSAVAAWCETIFADHAFVEWENAAALESATIPETDMI